MKSSISFVVLVFLSQTLASGRLGYNDECNLMDNINPFANSADQCNSNLAFTCLNGRCKCNPLTSVWEAGPLGLIGINALGKCAIAVGRPCLGSSNVCASNAACSSDGVLSLCICNKGYTPRLDGSCTSFGNRIKRGFGILIFSLIASSIFSR